MGRDLTFLAGLGVGTGLLYYLQQRRGDAERFSSRDQSNRLVQEACGVPQLAGSRRSIPAIGPGPESSSGRDLAAGAGVVLFALGLSRSAPLACLLGTAGLGLATMTLLRGRSASFGRPVAGRGRDFVVTSRINVAVPLEQQHELARS